MNLNVPKIRSASAPPWRAALSCGLAVFLVLCLALREPFRGWQATVELAGDQGAGALLEASAREVQREEPAFSQLRWTPAATHGPPLLIVESQARDRQTLQDRLNAFARAVRNRESRRAIEEADEWLRQATSRSNELTRRHTAILQQIDTERREQFERQLAKSLLREENPPPAAAPPLDPARLRSEELRSRLFVLLQSRTEDHPEIVRLRAELAAAENPAPPLREPLPNPAPPAGVSEASRGVSPLPEAQSRTGIAPLQYLARGSSTPENLPAEGRLDNSPEAAPLQSLYRELNLLEKEQVTAVAARDEAEQARDRAAHSSVRISPAAITRRWGGSVPGGVILLAGCLALSAGFGAARFANGVKQQLETAVATVGLPFLGVASLRRDQLERARSPDWFPITLQTADLLIAAVLVVLLVGVVGSRDVAALLWSDPLSAAAMAVDYLQQPWLAR